MPKAKPESSSPAETPRIRRHVFLADVHVPHNINLSPIVGFVKDYKPTHFIIGGDFLNLEWASHWNEKEFKYIGLEKLRGMLEKELEAGRKALRELNSVLPDDCEKYYIPGNHEEWLYWACMTYPALAPGSVTLGVEQMTFKSDLAEIRKQVVADLLTKYLGTEEIGFQVLRFGKELNLGRITYLHGHQVGSIAAMKRKFPARNVVCGHHHTEAIETQHNSGDLKSTNQYVMVPCLCRLSPGYLTDGSTRWVNGFFTADVLPTGNFDGKIVKIVDGCIMANGKLYK